MSGFDNNPFAEPVDVNPFQVNIYLFIMSSVICKMLKLYAPQTCLVGLLGSETLE